MLAISQSAFAIAIVAVLVALFLGLLLGSFARSRRSVAAPTGALVRPEAAPARPATKPKVVLSRRDFFRGGLVTSVLVFAAQFGGATLAFLWPNLKGGFGSVVTVPDSLDDVKSFINQNRQPYYFGSARFYIVSYNGDGADTVYQGITQEGLMALYQKCVHLGCRVPFCQQSQWFECPCHGSKYNEAGEYQLGPAPRGLDRFALSVEGTSITVDTSSIVPGPPRGTNTIHQSPEGPFCV